MIDLFQTKETLIKSGIGPCILSLSGYIYSVILFIVALYYLFRFIIKKL
ncbi:hypothetical protein [Caloramator sp. E03]|nr:hypothetical protein [Caloramator sp. E03]